MSATRSAGARAIAFGDRSQVEPAVKSLGGPPVAAVRSDIFVGSLLSHDACRGVLCSHDRLEDAFPARERDAGTLSTRALRRSIMCCERARWFIDRLRRCHGTTSDLWSVGRVVKAGARRPFR